LSGIAILEPRKPFAGLARISPCYNNGLLTSPVSDTRIPG
jgi:hypothetical protein